MRLVKHVYDISANFPKEEMFGLSQQIRRAAVSIPSNLAEGAARNGSREFVQFMGVARGSLAELETQLQIAVMLEYMPSDHKVFEVADRTGRLLTGLHKKLNQTR